MARVTCAIFVRRRLTQATTVLNTADTMKCDSAMTMLDLAETMSTLQEIFS